ncbi:MAG: M23 family metallopeptidase [Caulobacteraceae bacterium]
MGKTCEIQNYFDRAPAPGVLDYRCGHRTYAGHDGVDIRAPSLAIQRAGVMVLAAADGRVERMRDGVADANVRQTGVAAVKGKECGNGMMISHGGGWETQYCHMEAGRFRVHPGQEVKAGEPLGEMGLSGDTEFPHLHITVRHDGQAVDPFAYGAAPGACGGGRNLWRADLQPSLAYRRGEVLNVGFAQGAVTSDMVDQNGANQPPPNADTRLWPSRRPSAWRPATSPS